MLYDPKWETTVAPVTKPDIFALPTLIAWLEKQPAEMPYEYTDCKGLCLLGQYMTAHGVDWYERMNGTDAYTAICIATGWGSSIAVHSPYTFGAALERTRGLAEMVP